jgi:uncharacterized protein YkwD
VTEAANPGNSPGIQTDGLILGAMSGLLRYLLTQRRLLAITLGAALVSSVTVAEGKIPSQSGAAERARVVQLVNEARSHGRRCGSERFAAAAPLHTSRQLSDAAAAHARDMLRNHYFEHRGSDGSQPSDRVQRAGYPHRLTGENIALGPESAEEVVAGWLASPGHCANIMEPRFRDIGVALASGKKRGQIYWVQEFGAPR